jgi:hypothetical protein
LSRLHIGVRRYASVATAIGHALGVEPAPDCSIGQRRITVTFRRAGAWRWSGDQQIEHALRVADVVRAVLADDPRRAVRKRVTRAIVVVYEDSTLVHGCEVLSRWQCVVPAASR